jgi:Mannitol-1-phosphate/altronate dehydrogenases
VQQLSYKLKDENKNLKERVIQFGEGNFLRCFVDWQIDKMNKELGMDMGIVVVQTQAQGLVKLMQEQDNLYTVYLQGILNGEEIEEHDIVTSIVRSIDPFATAADYQSYLALADNADLQFVVSNTTEAGIYFDETEILNDAPTVSFVGKLTALLYRRYQKFNGSKDSGLIFLPCELIEQNGTKLRETILKYAHHWQLDPGFTTWIEDANTFCCTLVDRIVPGYPRDTIEEVTTKLGYKDNLVVVGEPFNLFAIEGPELLKTAFPADKVGANTIVVEDLAPYRTRKVRILNGLHTAMVPIAYLLGFETVGAAVADETINKFIKVTTIEEIMPNIDLPKDELLTFTTIVVDERFANPFIKHYLMSIALNAIAKYKTRDLPSVLECIDKGIIPNKLLFALAALIVFYGGKRGTETIELVDDAEVLKFFANVWTEYANDLDVLVEKVLQNTEFWGQDLTDVAGITTIVQGHLQLIVNEGMPFAVAKVLNNNL